MSNPPTGSGMPPSRSTGMANNPVGIGAHTQQTGAQGGGGGVQSQHNLNQIVLEYLSKKGYTKTEATLRKESSAHSKDTPGKRASEEGGYKYDRALDLLMAWVDDNLDLYKPELRRLLWPIFVYSFLNLIFEGYHDDGARFFAKYRVHFEREHEGDVCRFTGLFTSDHVEMNPLSRLYKTNRYRLSFTSMALQSLYEFLEAKEYEGGSIITSLMQRHFDVKQVARARAGAERSLASMLAKGAEDDEPPPEDEGIPGHNPGSARTEMNGPTVLPTLKLGRLPMEPELLDDVRAELQEEDAKNPPGPGEQSLVEVLEQRIKQDPNDETIPSRDAVPLPPSLARNVAMEVQKIKENRDRFKIFAKTTGGLGPGISVCMFTFHNTYDTVNCIDFSGDYLLVAVGTGESYIRVWSLDGKPLTSMLPPEPGEDSKPVASRRLIGHSGPVYGVSFSPSTAPPYESTTQADGTTVPPLDDTKPQYLLSASCDGTIRLWSLDVWSCLVAYRIHLNPVWDVQWSPHGHYFASISRDRTARVWATDHIAPLRTFVGHDDDVEVMCWHPNGGYLFTGSGDRTVRMWDVQRATSVRMFTGHQSHMTAMACNEQGTVLASADDNGLIFLWDLASGRRTKRMRGHGKSGIWSLSWCVEGTVLVSGGADATVRVWDCVHRASESAGANAGKAPDSGGAGGDGAASSAGAGAGSVAPPARNKKREKEAVISPDHISAFPTKKSPVYKVMFTRGNLVMVGGAYLTEDARSN